MFKQIEIILSARKEDKVFCCRFLIEINFFYFFALVNLFLLLYLLIEICPSSYYHHVEGMRKQTVLLIVFLIFGSFFGESQKKRRRNSFSKLRKDVEAYKKIGRNRQNQIETLNKQMKDIEDVIRYHRLEMPSECGQNAKSNRDLRIVGGQPADPNEWPWLAALVFLQIVMRIRIQNEDKHDDC